MLKFRVPGRRPVPWMLALIMSASALVVLGQPAGAAPTPSAASASASASTSSAASATAGTAGRSDTVKKNRGRHTWKTVERLVPVVTGPNDDIAIDLDTRLYLPNNASRKNPQPAILMTHGFGLTKDSNEILTTARFFAAHGYVVLTFTSSGFGNSGGCVTLQSADYDVKSASQLIDQVLEPRKDVLHNRRGAVVGTIGGSYGGGIQLPLAAHDKRIRASVVGRTWDNLIYSLDPNNRVVPGDKTGLTHSLNPQGVFKQEWTSLFYALGNAQPATGGGSCPETKQASGDPEEIAAAPGRPGYYLALCRTASGLAATGNYDEESRALIARASARDVPGQGQDPGAARPGAERHALQRQRRGGDLPRALASQGAGRHDLELRRPRWLHLAARRVRGVRRRRPHRPGWTTATSACARCGWMDHWLRGKKGGRGPAFTYYRDWEKYAGTAPNDEQYGAASRFPLRRTTDFTLSGSDALAAPGATVEAGSASFLNPQGGQPAAYTEKSQFTGPDAEPELAGHPAARRSTGSSPPSPRHRSPGPSPRSASPRHALRSATPTARTWSSSARSTTWPPTATRR